MSNAQPLAADPRLERVIALAAKLPEATHAVAHNHAQVQTAPLNHSQMETPMTVKMLALGLLLAAPASAEVIKPFTSDGCSSFPDGTPGQQDVWLQCCTAHDRAYWKGGTYRERMDADLELRSCVAQVDEPEIAAVMLVGVRVGGSPVFPTRFRWGYGWSWPRWYGPLSADELKQVEQAAQDAQ